MTPKGRARDLVGVGVEVEASGGGLRVVLDTPEPVGGLTLRLPSGYVVVSTEHSNLVRTTAPGLVVFERPSEPATLALVREGSRSGGT